MSYITAEDIGKHIFIVDIAHEFGISLEEAGSSNFDYRCRCPSIEHKGGKERTPSCYINSSQNSFRCFGCNIGNTVVNFYMACASVTFADAMTTLKSRLDPGIKLSGPHIKEQNNFAIILETSLLLRSVLKSNPEDFDWIHKTMKKIDGYISEIKHNDIDKAKALHKEVAKILAKRYGIK